MTTRAIKKSLIAKQDLLLGKGTAVQTRNGLQYPVDKLDLVMSADSIADLSGLVGDYDGQKVSVKGYHAGSDVGGGIFYLDSSRTGENDGGAVFNGWVRQYSGEVNAKWFGAVGDGVVDDTIAINKATAYLESIGGGVLHIPSGVYLLGNLTPTIYSTVGGVLAGFNSWALLFARNNVTIKGEGSSTTLKAAGGLVATNANLAGTKGFQVFVHKDYQIDVNNFLVKDLVVDFNGANNLMEPLNGYGNQSLVQGIYIERGDYNGVDNVKWLNHSGHQVVVFSYYTTNCYVTNCDFIDAGWLHGTNTLLTDHSSIYTAGNNWLVANNKFIQSEVVPVGASYELHGSGIARDNYTKNYAAITNIAAIVVQNAHVTLLNNISVGTGGGLGIYASNAFSVYLRLQGNSFALNGKEVTGFPLVGSFKQMFYAGENTVATSSGVSVTIESSGNTYSVESPIEWAPSTTELNTFITAQNTKAVFKLDTINSIKGALLNQQRSGLGNSVVFSKCTFLSCGSSGEWKTQNSIVNYTNAFANNYGERLFELQFEGNSFLSCAYAAYIDIMQDAAGSPVLPQIITIDNDTHDIWVSPARGLDNIPSTIINATYTVKGIVDIAKPLPESGTLVASFSGVINAQYPLGWGCKFKSFANVSQWNFYGEQFGLATPATPRPFGDKVGDRYKVLIVAPGSPCEFLCTVAGVGGALGNWAALTLN
jgi:hypothetical protein